VGIVEAALIGLVQGLTEFLPVSSTAHVRILPALLDKPDPGAAFTAAIQIGTLLAVLIYFRKDLAEAFAGWLGSLTGKKFDRSKARMGWAVVLGTIPIVVLGVAFQSSIERELRSLLVVAWSLIGMGLVLLVAEAVGRRKRGEADVMPADGVWVGFWQSLALVPGMSRSGSSIAGALFAGFGRAEAARFSFLLSVPSVLAAGVYSVLRHRESLLPTWLGGQGEMFAQMLVANAAAFVSGYAAIAFLIRFLKRHGTFVFVVYRVALGAILLWMVHSGRLSPLAGLPEQTRAPAPAR